MIAPLPFNSETGLWCEPMISANGYSVSANVPSEKLATVRDVVAYLTSAEVQEKMALRLATTPVDKSVLASPAIKNNPALLASMEQITHGRPMPIRPRCGKSGKACAAPTSSS